MLCTQDDVVFDVLAKKGWPNSFYTIQDSLWDIRMLTNWSISGLASVKEEIPQKIFQRYDIEFAKELVKSKYNTFSIIPFFAKRFLTRELIEEEIDEVLQHTPDEQKPDTEMNIGLLNRTFKNNKLDLLIKEIGERRRSEGD